MSNHIILFEDTRKEDVPVVGGKAANLGEMTAAGFPVPPGFTVPATSYFEFVRATGLEARISELLEGLDVNNTSMLELRADEIRRTIIQATMPEEMTHAIREAYGLLDSGRASVAVRSSATAEDLPDDSFAGQQATFLNVRGADDVVHAVQACMASLFERRAIFYRATRGYPHLSVGLAVVVQVMVQSDKAGVMFTVNTVNGNPDHIDITAGYGLGELVVSGDVTPDSYIVSKATGQIIEREVNSQSKMLVLNPGDDGSAEMNILVSVPSYLQDAPKLSDEQINALADLGKRVEQHYGRPQDTEWAIDEDGKLWLIQARPVTKISSAYLLEANDALEPEPAKLLLRGNKVGDGVGFGRVVVLSGPKDCHLVQKGDVMVADMTSPDYVPAMERAAGLVTQRGGRACHAAIVAREMGLPCVIGAKNALDVLGERIGQTVTVDSAHGEVFEGVAATRIAWAQHQRELLAAKEAELANIKTNTKVMVILANPGLASQVAARNVDGVGLVRIEEILGQDGIGIHPQWFVDNGQKEDFTSKLYDQLRPFPISFGDRDVVIRTLDFKKNEMRGLEHGADYEREDEENPMMGERGVYRYRKHPEVFAMECEAYLRLYREFGRLTLMIPFVRNLGDARWVVDFLAERGLQRGMPGFKLWMMVEVPSNVWSLEKFLEFFDGVSIGSNDLTQLGLGVDRDHSELSEAYDETDESVLWAIEHVVRTTRSLGKTVGLCGQAVANNPEFARNLVEWGATSLSVTQDTISQAREIVIQTERELGILPA